MKRSAKPSYLAATPFFTCVMILVVVFIAEAAVMVLLSLSAGLSVDIAQAFLDSTLLTIFITPFLWRFIVQPLRSSALETHLRSTVIIDNAGDAIISIDDRGQVITFNAAAEAIFGYRQEELLGQSMTCLLPERCRESHRHGFAQAVATGALQHARKMIELQGLRKNGEEFPLELMICACKANGRTFYTAFIHDITKRKQAEREHMRLATAVEQAAGSIAITDTAGVIQYVNCAFEKISGYPAPELVGNGIRILKSGKHDQAFYQNLWTTVFSGKNWQGSIINRRKNGSLYQEEKTIAPVFDPSGRIINFVCNGRDVTQEIQLEAQLRQAQKMDAIGTLAGGIAHDFNNLLQVIQGYAQLTLRSLASDAPQRDNLKELLKAAEKSTMLVRQLLIFSRHQEIQPQIIDLNTVIESLLKMLRRVIGEHIDLTVEKQDDLHPIFADPGQLEQMIMNLCINARDAMPGGGRLSITSGNVCLDRTFAREHLWAREGCFARLTVEDSGTGMSPEILERIFEPFFTTKEAGKGTGLGLAIVYGIIKRHEGLIHVSSHPGQGTKFSIYFPYASRSEIVRREAVKVERPQGGSETILLAEDDEGVRSFLSRILDDAGYKVLAAENGEAALILFDKHGQEIDLVMMDLVMPKMGGLDLCKELSRKRPGLPVLLSTGYNPELREGHLEPQAEIQLIQKPFNADDLLHLIRRILGTAHQN